MAKPKENVVMVGMDTSSIQAWIAAHTHQLSSDIRSEMRDAEQRRGMIRALNELRADVARCGESAVHLKPARERLERLVEQYPELEGTFATMLFELGWEEDKYRGRDYDEGEKEFLERYSSPDGKWGSAIRGAIDAIGETNQMGLISIQDLSSKLQQAQQLGSNLVSAINQTQMAIINNIRG